MRFPLHWRTVGGRTDEAWDWSRVLYAYLHPVTREAMYIGKSWGTTVGERWGAADKIGGVWAFLNEIGIDRHELVVGEPLYDDRLTKQLLADVESLLIARLQPIANIASKRSRISRPGLIVQNTGAPWIGPREFRDV